MVAAPAAGNAAAVTAAEIGRVARDDGGGAVGVGAGTALLGVLVLGALAVGVAVALPVERDAAAGGALVVRRRTLSLGTLLRLV